MLMLVVYNVGLDQDSSIGGLYKGVSDFKMIGL